MMRIPLDSISQTQMSGGRACSSLLNRNRHALNNLANNLLGLFRLLERRRVSGVDHHTVAEYRNSKLLEILWSSEGASVEVGHGLGGAVEHLRATRGNPQS